MKSKIAEAIKPKYSPVAVLWTDEKPEGALQFTEGKWGCVSAMLFNAAKGSTAAFDEKTCGCSGGAVGLGFKKFKPGYIEYFLSTGDPEKNIEGEHHRKDPGVVKGFIDNLSEIKVPTKYVVFKPLEKVTETETPQGIIFLVNADQLSALVVFANYDRPTNDNVLLVSAAGCHQTVLEVIAQNYADNPKAILGMTDISARKFVDKDLLSFGLPYKRFLELEAQVEESFLTKSEWLKLLARNIEV